MRLTLSILRCPEDATPETRTVEGGEFSIGRGPDNDWVLPDPDRHLSKHHCVLAFRSGDWQVADLSSNGTFLNGEPDPIRSGAPRRLRDGDRLRIGAFEVEVGLSRPGVASRDSPLAAGRDSPFDADPFGPSAFGVGRFGAGSFTGAQDAPGLLPERGGIGLPADFDPMAPDPDDAYRAPVQSDHSPSTSDAFRPAQPIASLPDDWADDLMAPAPAAAPSLPPVQAASPPVAPAPAGDAGLLTAFLAGAGMAGTQVADPVATMTALGQVMRATVSGLRQVLIARAAVKAEFRIEQTMISARGNNPLKFAADDDDALSALVGGGRRTAMPAPEAVADALRDIRLHELASMAAMQEAVRSVVAKLDPAALRRANDGGLGLPVHRKARAWDAFEALHAQVSRALSDDFDSVFGKAFARAYEQAEAELDKERDRP